MFVNNLSAMAGHPYSCEVNEIVREAMGIFRSKCTGVANRGGRSIVTTAQYYDGDYDERTFYFGNYGENYCCLSRVPENMRESVFVRVQEQLREELRKAGFKDFMVEGITEGPIYLPLYLFGRRTLLKDKSDPQYKKYIRITASW